MKKIKVAILALMLSGCASREALKSPTQTATVAKHVVTSKAPSVQPAAEAKSPTFKERWFDRFMRHKRK